MANILAVGIAALDIINITDGFPEEDDEVRAVSQEIRRGGNATNTLVVLSQLGHQCHWAGSLANDSQSTIIKNELDHFNINYSGCELHPGGVTPTSYITLNRQNGSRTIVHYRDLPEMSANTFVAISLNDVNWVHFEGRNVEQTKRMLSYLKESKISSPVSLEIEKPRDNLQELYRGADIYFFSKSFAQSIEFDSAEKFLLHYRRLIPDSLLVCTWGSEGAYALEKQQLHFAPATAITAIDTIGAGDTFNAGFIHAQLQRKNTQKCLEYACELAAKKCTIYGFKDLV